MAAIMASWLFRVAARTSSCVGMLAMVMVSFISLMLQTIPSMIEMSSRRLTYAAPEAAGKAQRYWSPRVLDDGGLDW